MDIKRVLVSPAAEAVIRSLQAEYGELFFHQSGGCCEGSYPHCFEKDGFLIGSNDVCIGIIADCKFYMAADQFDYWKHTQLTLDVMDGRAASFSLESTIDKAFFIQSRIFTEEELNHLESLEEN